MNSCTRAALMSPRGARPAAGAMLADLGRGAEAAPPEPSSPRCCRILASIRRRTSRNYAVHRDPRAGGLPRSIAIEPCTRSTSGPTDDGGRATPAPARARGAEGH